MYIETVPGFIFYRGEIKTKGVTISPQNILNIERGFYIARSENNIKVFRADYE
jgi:hypothetical protein